MTTKIKSNWLAKLKVLLSAPIAIALTVFLSAFPLAQTIAREESTKQQENVLPSQPKDDKQRPEPLTTDTILVVVQKMPEFPGGDRAIMKYLRENINYPEKAMQKGIEGTVYITFMVETDGRITDVKLLRGIGGGCDEEAVRVIENMPNWKPGEIRDEVSRVAFTMPIRFSLDDKKKKKTKKTR